MELTAENKELMNMGDFNYFEYGVHKVRLMSFTEETSNDGKVYVEVFFESEDGERNESKRQYFTTPKGINFSFNLLRSLYVASAPEKLREQAEKTIQAVKTTTELVDKLNEKAAGTTAWISKYPSATRTMTNGKPAPEVMLSATQPRSRMVADAEAIFGAKAEPMAEADPTEAWGK